MDETRDEPTDPPSPPARTLTGPVVPDESSPPPLPAPPGDPMPPAGFEPV